MANLNAGGPFWRVKLFIIDDYDQNAAQKPRHVYSIHEASCVYIRECITNVFGGETVSVRHPKGTRKAQYLRWWEDQIKQMGPNDLAIIFFEGVAGGAGDEYTISQASYPRNVNLRAVFGLFSRKRAPNALFLLDAWIQLRNPRPIVRRTGTTEVIARGEQWLLPGGRPDTSRHFTTFLVDRLEQAYSRMKDGKLKSKGCYTFSKLLRTGCSVPEDAMASPAKYVGVTQSKKQRLEPRRRVVFRIADGLSQSDHMQLGFEAFKDSYDPDSPESTAMAEKEVRACDIFDIDSDDDLNDVDDDDDDDGGEVELFDKPDASYVPKNKRKRDAAFGHD